MKISAQLVSLLFIILAPPVLAEEEKSDDAKLVGPAMTTVQPKDLEPPSALNGTDVKVLDETRRPDAIVGPAMQPPPAESETPESKKKTKQKK